MGKYIIVVIFVILLAGGLFLLNQNTKEVTQNQTPAETQTVRETKKIEGFKGELLAGKASPYLTFTKEDYDKAKASNKIIFLDFYANWCPICRGEAPEIHAGFDSLTTDQVIGLRVNYNDSDTDADEKALGKQFEISYQHTKVILKNGKEVLRSGETWNTDEFLKQINKVVSSQ